MGCAMSEKYLYNFSVRLTKPNMDRVWAVANAQGVRRTDIIKKAILKYVEEQEKLTLGVNQNENG